MILGTSEKLTVGAVYEIAHVHHPAFASWVGTHVVLMKLDGDTAYVSKNEPVRYRINRLGRRVLDHDPRCIQTLMDVRQLRRSSQARYF